MYIINFQCISNGLAYILVNTAKVTAVPFVVRTLKRADRDTSYSHESLVESEEQRNRKLYRD